MKYIHYIITLLGFMTLLSCQEKPKPTQDLKQKFVLSDTIINMIATDSATTCFINDAVTLTGEVSYNENTVNKVFARGSGQVISCKVSLGDKVHAGQTLAIIKSADIAANYADLTSAKADAKIAKRQVDNTEALYKNGIASEKELTEARESYQKALSVINKIEANIAINGGNKTNSTGTYELVAPTDGYIVEKKINEGNFVRADLTDNLFTISNLKNVWVNANVFETDIPKMKEGLKVQVTTLAYPDKIFEGKIDKVSEVLDPSNKTMKIRITLDNSQMLLKPEMFTKVIVSESENKKAVCIPLKSLITNNGKNYVVIFNSKSDMKIAEISIVKVVNDKIYINSGVEPGQKVITQNELLIFQQLLNQ